VNNFPKSKSGRNTILATLYQGWSIIFFTISGELDVRIFIIRFASFFQELEVTGRKFT
jgi:hypothetical protein